MAREPSMAKQYRNYQRELRRHPRAGGEFPGGCMIALVALPFTALWALLHQAPRRMRNTYCSNCGSRVSGGVCTNSSCQLSKKK